MPISCCVWINCAVYLDFESLIKLFLCQPLFRFKKRKLSRDDFGVYYLYFWICGICAATIICHRLAFYLSSLTFPMYSRCKHYSKCAINVQSKQLWLYECNFLKNNVHHSTSVLRTILFIYCLKHHLQY